jgi:CheY-like chemotaxis protein
VITSRGRERDSRRITSHHAVTQAAFHPLTPHLEDPAMATPSHIPSHPLETAGGRLLVLVVDDDSDCVRSLNLLLERFGYEAAAALDGPSALAEARDHPPDVVLLDLALPGMDGYEVSRQLHEREGQKPPFVIALSGFADDAERRSKAGIDLHLLKPVDPDELVALLERFCHVVSPAPGEGEPT